MFSLSCVVVFLFCAHSLLPVDHGVFQIEIDTSLNRLAIFIVLGIGADDIFIVMGE